MSKIFKILLISSIFFIFTFNFNLSHATSETNNNLDENSENIVQEDSSSQTALSTLAPTSGSSVTGVSTMNSYSQANLDLNNILCIILIAIGVLIILLSIAILIRLKK